MGTQRCCVGFADFMFIAVFWECGPKYSLRCLLHKFKEKTAEEVPLTGKKSVEIKEMLLVIYPTSTKLIGESICSFLLDLAKEYMRL